MNPKDYTNLPARLRANEKITKATAPGDLSALSASLKNLLRGELYLSVKAGDTAATEKKSEPAPKHHKQKTKPLYTY